MISLEPKLQAEFDSLNSVQNFRLNYSLQSQKITDSPLPLLLLPPLLSQHRYS
jgi:hypothetical protein